jgi:hypothetical protein
MGSATPSLAPTFDADTYLVLDEIGSSRVYRETEEIEAHRVAVIRDISEGQYSQPRRVVAFNTAEGWSRDVTADIAHEMLEVALRSGEPVTRSARDFIERVTNEELPLAAIEGH